MWACWCADTESMAKRMWRVWKLASERSAERWTLPFKTTKGQQRGNDVQHQKLLHEVKSHEKNSLSLCSPPLLMMMSRDTNLKMSFLSLHRLCKLTPTLYVCCRTFRLKNPPDKCNHLQVAWNTFKYDQKRFHRQYERNSSRTFTAAQKERRQNQNHCTKK